MLNADRPLNLDAASETLPEAAPPTPTDKLADVPTEIVPSVTVSADAPHAVIIPSAARHPVPAAPDMVSIPRGTFNAAIVGVVMLIVGGVLGYMLRDRAAVDTNALADRVVGTVVASLPAGAVPQPTRDPNFRFTIAEGDNPAIGPEGAPITLIEFGDFKCGYCARFVEQTLPRLLEDYEGRIRYVFRDYPILGQDSVDAAFAAECADDQGQFWPFHDRLYANQQALIREQFITYATELDMDVDRFTTCLETRPAQQNIVDDYGTVQALGIGGTPTFFLNGKLISGAQPYEVFAVLFEQELALAAATAEPS